MSTAPDAASDSEWSATRASIEALPAELRAGVWAAALPRRFDESILRALLATPGTDVDAVVRQLQSLPFVTTHPDGGHVIAPAVRRRLLDELWTERRETLLAGSARLMNYFTDILVGPARAGGPWAGFLEHPLVRSVRAWHNRRYRHAEFVASTSSAVPIRIEQLYHAIVARPEWADTTITSQATDWLNEMEPNPAAVTALAEAIAEQARAGRASVKLKHWGWFFEAETAHKRHDFVNAKRLLIRVVCRTQNDWLRANAAFGLAMLHRETWAPGKARASVRLALSYYDAWNNAPGQANSHWLLGFLNLRDHRLDDAKRDVLRALSLLRRPSHDLNTRANCYWTLGEIEAKREAYDAARTYYDKARALYGQVGSRLGICNCLTSLGGLALQHGRLNEAHQFLVEGQALAEAMGTTLSIANVLDDLGRVHEHLREFDQSAAQFEAAATLHRTIHNPVSEGAALVRLGGVEWARRRPAEAQAAVAQGLAILRTQGRSDGLSSGLAQAAGLKIQHEAFADAFEMLREGARLADTDGAVALRAELQRRLARLAIDRSELELAGQALRAAEACVIHDADFPLTQAANLACAADLAIARGDLRMARDHVVAAADLYSQAGAGALDSWKTRNLGELDILAGDLDTGRERLEEALRLAAGQDAVNERLACLESLALYRALQGDPAAAVRHLTDAIDRDSYPPAHLWLDRADHDRRLGDLTAVQNDLDAAAAAGVALSALAYSRAQLALASGRPDAAIAELATVLENWPRNLLAALMLGLAHLAAGRPDQALEQVRGALAANTVFPAYVAHVELQLIVGDLMSTTGPNTGVAHDIAHQITDHLRRFPRHR